MHAIVAEEFGGYQNLKLVDISKPAVSIGRVLVRMTLPPESPRSIIPFSLRPFWTRRTPVPALGPICLNGGNEGPPRR
jgi:hypothetical protein